MPDSPARSGSCLPLHFYFIELSKSLGSNHNGFFLLLQSSKFFLSKGLSISFSSV